MHIGEWREWVYGERAWVDRARGGRGGEIGYIGERRADLLKTQNKRLSLSQSINMSIHNHTHMI